MKTPAISVVICTRNGSKYLREQLDSIVKQSLPPDEIIVQDDASTDDTLQILAAYKETLPLVVYQNPTCLGYNRNFMSALLKANGEYILISDQDDIWVENKIEKLVKNIGNHSLIFHNSVLFRDSDTILGLRYAVPPVTHPAYITIKPYIPGHQILFKREALPYLKKMSVYECPYDYVLSTICANLNGVAYLHENLVYWRRHSQAVTLVPVIHPNRLLGYLRSLAALAYTSKRRITRRYFRLLTQFPLHDPVARRLVKLMGHRHWPLTVWQACFLCLCKHRAFYADSSSAPMRLRSFFLPLVFVRDYANFILRTP